MTAIPWYYNPVYFILIAILASLLIYVYLDKNNSHSNKLLIIAGFILILWAFWQDWSAFIPPTSTTVNGVTIVSGVSGINFWFYTCLPAGILLILLGIKTEE
ncbi:MAG: hypothetical protein ACP5GS_07450 [Nitrososphaeria archaeon]